MHNPHASEEVRWWTTGPELPSVWKAANHRADKYKSWRHLRTQGSHTSSLWSPSEGTGPSKGQGLLTREAQQRKRVWLQHKVGAAWATCPALHPRDARATAHELPVPENQRAWLTRREPTRKRDEKVKGSTRRCGTSGKQTLKCFSLTPFVLFPRFNYCRLLTTTYWDSKLLTVKECIRRQRRTHFNF